MQIGESVSLKTQGKSVAEALMRSPGLTSSPLSAEHCEEARTRCRGQKHGSVVKSTRCFAEDLGLVLNTHMAAPNHL